MGSILLDRDECQCRDGLAWRFVVPLHPMEYNAGGRSRNHTRELLNSNLSTTPETGFSGWVTLSTKYDDIRPWALRMLLDMPLQEFR